MYFGGVCWAFSKPLSNYYYFPLLVLFVSITVVVQPKFVFVDYMNLQHLVVMWASQLWQTVAVDGCWCGKAGAGSRTQTTRRKSHVLIVGSPSRAAAWRDTCIDQTAFYYRTHASTDFSFNILRIHKMARISTLRVVVGLAVGSSIHVSRASFFLTSTTPKDMPASKFSSVTVQNLL